MAFGNGGDAAAADLVGVLAHQILAVEPDLAEGGLDGYAVEMWYGLFMPAKPPPAIINAVHRETSRIAATAEFREKMEATGHTVVNSTPAEFTEKVKSEVEKFRKIIIASKMQQD